MRDGLKLLLDNQHDMKVVGETDNGRDVVKLALKLNPDVIIMDVYMPDLTGVDATHRILKNQRGIKVIGSSMSPDPGPAIGMLKAGASGYILLDRIFEELADAIKNAVADKVYISPFVISQKAVQEYLNRANIVAPSRKKKPVKPKQT